MNARRWGILASNQPAPYPHESDNFRQVASAPFFNKIRRAETSASQQKSRGEAAAKGFRSFSTLHAPTTFPRTGIDGIFLQDTVDREQQKDMTEEEREQAKAAVVTSVGAGVGSAGGATVGVLELAARGAATGFSAGLAIGVGAAAGAGIAYGIYRLFKKRKS